MKIYEPVLLGGYELCQPVNVKDFESINLLINGKPQLNSWKPISVQIIREDEGITLQESDSPWLGEHALIFRPSVIDSLGELLIKYGEILPLTCADAEVYVFNPTKVIDALDENASSILRFSSGRIMDIDKYAFKNDVVRNVHIFKIPNLRVSPTFVSQHFVDLWRKSQFKGLGFEQIWPN